MITFYKNRLELLLIFSLFVFSFFWLAEIRPILSDLENRLLRYTFSIVIVIIYFLSSKIKYINKFIFINVLIMFICFYSLNVFHLNISLFANSFYIFPFLIVLFYSNTSSKNNDNFKFDRYILFFHIIILIYAIKGYYLNYIGVLSQFNHNEISIFSFILTVLLLISSELYKKYLGKIFFINIFFTFLISYLLEARAITISSVFIFVLLFIRIELLKKLFLFLLSIITFFIPIIIVECNDKVRFIHEYILKSLGAKGDVINADSDRYDMYLLVKNTITNNTFGKGFGNTDYLSQISISGLHSGTLDLLYWGGYPLYIIFMLIFISIIYYSYFKCRLFLSASLLIYWLLLLNYYEGLLFGNMGITILYVYLVMSYYNRSSFAK